MNDPLRVIVIQDQYLLAETLCDVLLKLGYAVQGMAANVKDALDLLGSRSCDIAVFDLDLRGETAVCVLDRMNELGVPFLLATRAFVHDIPVRHLSATRVSKPYDMHEIRRALALLANERALAASPRVALRPKARTDVAGEARLNGGDPSVDPQSAAP